jgi:hypothetical protein
MATNCAGLHLDDKPLSLSNRFLFSALCEANVPAVKTQEGANTVQPENGASLKIPSKYGTEAGRFSDSNSMTALVLPMNSEDIVVDLILRM